LRFEVDDCHPVAGSQHQKAVIVDRSIAFVGGMDLCSGRWDDRTHPADDPQRARSWPGRGQYPPYHDVQAYVTGDAVDTLRNWFGERWRRATGEEFTPEDAPRTEIAIPPVNRAAIWYGPSRVPEVRAIAVQPDCRRRFTTSWRMAADEPADRTRLEGMITGPGERPLELCWYSHTEVRTPVLLPRLEPHWASIVFRIGSRP
jgi:phosphatidylserine/phosphatidylglycerophosphate/cardiolipin synthase-like enzyme